MSVQPQPAGPVVVPFDGATAEIAADAWAAPGVVLLGPVRLLSQSSVWYGSVLRADGDEIVLGERSNIQDGCVLHADPGKPVTIGSGVSIGHRAVVHGCTIDDDVLIGMSATVLNRAHIGSGSLIAAGTVVLEDAVIPPGSLVAGVPGRVRRSLTPAESERLHHNAATYVELAAKHAAVWRG